MPGSHFRTGTREGGSRRRVPRDSPSHAAVGAAVGRCGPAPRPTRTRPASGCFRRAPRRPPRRRTSPTGRRPAGARADLASARSTSRAAPAAPPCRWRRGAAPPRGGPAAAREGLDARAPAGRNARRAPRPEPSGRRCEVNRWDGTRWPVHGGARAHPPPAGDGTGRDQEAAARRRRTSEAAVRLPRARRHQQSPRHPTGRADRPFGGSRHWRAPASRDHPTRLRSSRHPRRNRRRRPEHCPAPPTVRRTPWRRMRPAIPRGAPSATAAPASLPHSSTRSNPSSPGSAHATTHTPRSR